MKFLVTWENFQELLILSMQVEGRDIQQAMDNAHSKVSRLFNEDQIEGWKIKTVSQL